MLVDQRIVLVQESSAPDAFHLPQTQLRALARSWRDVPVSAPEGLEAREFRLRISERDLGSVEECVREWSGQGRAVSLQSEHLLTTPKRLLVMDVDSTLILEECIDEMARLTGAFEAVSKVTARAMKGELDFRNALRERCRRISGAPQSIFRRVFESLTLTPGAERLVRAAQASGCRTAIVSGGFSPIVKELAENLGIDNWVANGLAVSQGRLTGEVLEPIVDSSCKERFLRDLIARDRLAPEQVVAIGDGANDLPMLRVAGLGVAFNAKPVVQQEVGHTVNLRRLDAVLPFMRLSST